jgi:DNA-binding NarL/FixJ family response regulator
MVTAVVVDDDVDIVEVFCEYLEIKDIQVVGRGHNGKTAVELYKKYNPDIVFLDLMMPDYDGSYALKNIRAINPKSKVIIVTADSSYETIEKIRKLNPTKIFVKPCDLKKIVQAVSDIN